MAMNEGAGRSFVDLVSAAADCLRKGHEGAQMAAKADADLAALDGAITDAGHDPFEVVNAAYSLVHQG